ncbi:MAG: FAD-dependent oxidoreductase [Deltaproteobacteria bacterium]|nr:FAD-dependent oxidoreductase [Deltaproteobacteria bacterium]
MPDMVCDVAIIGCGPAGLQAAIHARGKKTTVCVFGKPEKSSVYRAHIANFCCFKEIISGKDLLEAGKAQAENLGAAFITEDIVELTTENDRFVLGTENDRRVTSKALVLAMGIARKKLRVKGEKELLGRGVSYCVDCDAGFFKGLDVAVVGNESAAASGALTLLDFAKEVFLISKELNVTKVLQERLGRSAVQLLEGTWVKEILGDKEVDGVLLTNGDTLSVKGLFVELGAKGIMDLAANLGVVFDAETFSFIETKKKQETNISGLYAAGDITGEPWQIAKAVGEGCVAGLEAARYVKRISGE